MRKSRLLSILRVFDRQLTRRILLIAVGGTVMTLLGIKASTKDIDFNIPDRTAYNEFKMLYKRIRPGVKMDYYGSNMVFSEALPDDYIEKSINYKSNFSKIQLKILQPLDIVCSKISRCSDADIEDIRDCIKSCNLKKRAIIERAAKFSRAGNDKVFDANLKTILGMLF